MKIITLVEDSTCCALPAEHGLSIYIETGLHKVLFDLGTTDLFYKNAVALGIDLARIDTVIISHGHDDHGGGLNTFLQINDHAKIYLQKAAFEDHYTRKPTGPEYIGLDQTLKDHPQIILLDGDFMIDQTLRVFSHVQGDPYETNRNLLKEDFTMDDFVHEQHLVVSENGKNVLFMGCGHKGVLNILAQCPVKPDMVVGGFHLYSMRSGKMLPKEVIMELVRALPDTEYYTGHCTGDEALAILQRELPHLYPLQTGTSIRI